MKIKPLLFTFVLVLFAFQNTNANDTLKLKHNETYALFIGSPLEVEYSWSDYRYFKIKSIIRGDVDTANGSIIETIFINIKKQCPANKFETNKGYLILSIVLDRKEYPNLAQYKTKLLGPNPIECEDILPDTPENRKKLIEKYDDIKVIIHKPKPVEVKKNSVEDDFFDRLERKTKNRINHSMNRVVLWRIYMEPLDSNAQMSAVVDSVLKEDFNSKEKYFFFKNENLEEFKPNTHYLILTLAVCGSDLDYENKCDLNRKSLLNFPGKDNFLPDTPENRKLLSKKFDGLKIKYEYKKETPVRRGKDGKRIDIDL
jgi:hypothetical protein